MVESKLDGRDYIVRKVNNPAQPSTPPTNDVSAAGRQFQRRPWFITQSQWQSPSGTVHCPEGGPTVTA